MSATRDHSQNTKFVFSNFYHLYLKGKHSETVAAPLVKGLVLKTHSVVETPSLAEVRVVSSHQHEELKGWSQNNLKQERKSVAAHLRSLRDSRKRLSFLMQEVDEILKRG